jgi:predicted nucleic acid-binding protein
MIAYLDTSVLVRAFLPDEVGHREARDLLANEEVALVTGTWTRIEVAAALTRAARARRREVAGLLDAALFAMADEGQVAVVSAQQDEIERVAFRLARDHGLRAMDAWHLACALVVLPELAEAGEMQAFATRDSEQAAIAEASGLRAI